MKLLIVGARPESLGEAVAFSAADVPLVGDVVTAGVSGEEDYALDIRRVHAVHKFMQIHAPDHVVCTVGTNRAGTVSGPGWHAAMVDQMAVNYMGPMVLLAEWARYWRKADARDYVRHWVGVSSNSALIARSRSGSYCASKAALSMGIRCAAREMATERLCIWGVEPGWIDGTPMSNSVAERTKEKLHRIPGGAGMDRDDIAQSIVKNLAIGGRNLNGCLLRMDGGEQ